MAKRTKKSPSIIVRAKEALKEEFEMNPKNPSRRLVRKAGLAYVFNTPGSRRTVKRHAMDSGLRRVRRVVTRTAIVREGSRWTNITMDRISTHQRRRWLPAKLGQLAFRGKPDSAPIEILSVATTKVRERVEVSEASALPVGKVAALLLAVPVPGDKQK